MLVHQRVDEFQYVEYCLISVFEDIFIFEVIFLVDTPLQEHEHHVNV